jgi:hypothetical protein
VIWGILRFPKEKEKLMSFGNKKARKISRLAETRDKAWKDRIRKIKNTWCSPILTFNSTFGTRFTGKISPGRKYSIGSITITI